MSSWACNFLFNRFKCPAIHNNNNNKNDKIYKEIEKCGPFKETKQSEEKILEEAQMCDLLNKDFKTTVLKMLKELKEDMDKDSKTTYGQNENLKKR